MSADIKHFEKPNAGHQETTEQTRDGEDNRAINAQVIINKALFLKSFTQKELHRVSYLLQFFNIKAFIDERTTFSSGDNTAKFQDLESLLEIHLTGKKLNKRVYEDEYCTVHLKGAEGFPRYFQLSPKNTNKGNQFYPSIVKPFLDHLRNNGFANYTFSENQETGEYIVMPIIARSNTVDMNAKLINTIRCYFGENYLAHFKLLPNLKTYQPKNYYTDSRQLEYPKSSTWEGTNKLLSNFLNSIINCLAELKILKIVQPLNLSEEYCHQIIQEKQLKPKEELPKGEVTTLLENKQKKDETISLPSRPCAFCTPRINYNQLILDLGKFLILVNFMPYAHVTVQTLIVPQHIEDWSMLTAEDLEQLEIIKYALSCALQMNYKLDPKDIIIQVQNGVSAGQTVSGSHMHMVGQKKPLNFLHFILDLLCQMIPKPPQQSPDNVSLNNLTALSAQLEAIQTQALTSTTMHNIGDQLKPELLKNLIFLSAPHRFSVVPHRLTSPLHELTVQNTLPNLVFNSFDEKSNEKNNKSCNTPVRR